MTASHRPPDHRTEQRPDPRGEQTRQRILHTAIEVFAASGFEGASTRALAAQAGVNQPAIQYHFASKEGLYSAAVQEIADDLAHSFSAQGERVASALAGHTASSVELKELLFEMLDIFSTVILRDGRETEGMFIARAEIDNHESLNVLAEAIVDCMIKPCTALIGRILGRPAHDQDILIRTLAILGQIINFKNGCLGKSIRRSLGWRNMGESQKQAVRAIVREQTDAILTAAEKKSGSKH